MAGNDGELQTDEAMDWSTISARINSFRHFPRAKGVSAERLARAGFYFTGESDRVRCFSCQQTVENWSSADTPVNRHLQASPACKFLNCVHRTGNVGFAPLTNGSVYDEEAEAMQFSLRTGEVVDESTYPMAPHMCEEDARIRSFGTSWPASAPVRPRQLAQAGLYYLGEADRVQCFCCGGMLAGWEPGDEAWSEHSRHFPNCFFILGHDVGNVPSAQPPESDGPRVPMESYEERLASFAGRQHPVDHERLARAGFYSAGTPKLQKHTPENHDTPWATCVHYLSSVISRLSLLSVLYRTCRCFLLSKSTKSFAKQLWMCAHSPCSIML